MNLATARNELAAGITAAGDAHGYPRPPGQVAKFPAAIVRDPTDIDYHAAMKKRVRVDLPVFVIVSRQAVDDGVVDLDELISDTALPATLEAISGSWVELTVTGLDGGYVDFIQGGQPIGVGAVLTCSLTFTT